MGSGVCVYSPYPTGGMPLYVGELLDAMASSSGEGDPPVEWLSSTDLDPRFRAARYRVHPILPALRDPGESRTRIGYVLGRVRHHVRRDRFALSWLSARDHVGAVHVQEIPTLLPQLLVRRLRHRGIRVLVTVHNVRRHDYPPFLPPALVDGWVRRACLDADCLFVHSQGLADELERFLAAGGPRAQRPRIRVVPHGVWTVGAGPGPVDRETIERRLQGRRLLFFGTVRRNKGLHLLLEAAARGELAGYRLTVAGEAGEPDYLEGVLLPLVERARTAGFAVDLRPGFVPDEEVPALCADHDALVLPYTDAFVAQSGAAFMGPAHGLPIIATRSGGLDELLTEHRIGVLAESPTPAGVAGAVHELFSLTGRGVTELVDGMQRAAATLTWAGMATATLAEYRRVLAPGGPG